MISKKVSLLLLIYFAFLWCNVTFLSQIVSHLGLGVEKL